jgi:hypothetical protein
MSLLTNAVRIQEHATLFNAAHTIFHITNYIKDRDFSRDPIELSVYVITFCH